MDAMHIAEHGRLRLRQADAANLLSQIECAIGHRDEAVRAAREAYSLAWCDGPPFAYEHGMAQARENLTAVGEQEPTGLPSFDTSAPMPELFIIPTSPAQALTARPPLADQILERIIAVLPDSEENAIALQALCEARDTSQRIRHVAWNALLRLDNSSTR